MKLLILLFSVAFLLGCVNGRYQFVESMQDDRLSISACIDGLVSYSSKNTDGQRLLKEWDTAVTNKTSISTLKGITFLKGSESTYFQTTPSTSLVHPSEIFCVIDSEGRIISLVSRERIENSAKDISFIGPASTEEVEDFEKMVATVRSGKKVYTYTTEYRFRDNAWSAVGQTKVQKLDLADYQLN